MRRLFVSLLLLVLSAGVVAQEPQRATETITVTATKVAEDVTIVPASVTIVDGDQLRARNATDLATALATVAGVSIAPGGDSGPAGSVPEVWGLREFDAFLLVVDGVPWGGAFNPDLPTLDLTNVDRIEVLRGSAPVMYGATSFVGVIHVIHREAGAPGEAKLSAGNYGSGSANVTVPLSQSTSMRQSLTATAERRGFRDDNTGFDRAHVLYRAARELGSSTLRFDVDGMLLRQDPASPHLRQGRVLSTITPLDANYNARGARIDQNRLQGTLRLDTTALALPTTVTLALTHSTVKTTRGFIESLGASNAAAVGYDQDRDVSDAYFDAHVVKSFSPAVRVIAGIDHLFGNADGQSELFHYTVPLAGGNPSAEVFAGENDFSERRNFSGLYAATEWNATPRLRVDVGARLNHTSQHREAEDEAASDSNSRLSGSVGANWTAFDRNGYRITLFGDYRNTFKPAATDFGPDAEPDILEPEDAESYEVGAKGSFHDGRLRWETTAFQLDFTNLVVSTVRNGLPAIENAGSSRFRGGELELDWALTEPLRWALAYAYHDARFVDYVQAFDGVPTRLDGKRMEMSPFNTIGSSLVFAPKSGPTAYVTANYVGSRFLNKRNTALAAGYTTWAAGLGFRVGRGELRVDGRNLTDERPPIAESELGDAQYYRMPARSLDVSYRMNF